jgi:hypothetical protein
VLARCHFSFGIAGRYWAGGDGWHHNGEFDVNV